MSSHVAMDQAVKNTADRAGKYLTFTLADEEYGIGILKVKEIIGSMRVTDIPGTPSFVKGVINLRGKVIPIIDLRLKFGLEEERVTDRTCIIVVEIRVEDSTIQTGVIVDSVSEVLNIKSEDIEPSPVFGNSVNTNYILGLAKIDNQVKILLEINRVLSGQEAGLLDLID